MREIEIRDTGVKIAFTEEFSKEHLGNFIRDLVINADQAEAFHRDPIQELEKHGVKLSVDNPERFPRIDDETLIKLLKVRHEDEEEGKEEMVAFVILLFSIYESCRSG